ncbi:hypothetical protein ZWY2020_004885 [Hordeum vulgare]|nr:hypothetical protein ZWY2020_004885 [Hordeum vulgare]
MCSEPTSLAVLMAKVDKYATADSAMRVKVTASDKAVPTPTTPKSAGDNRGGQNNNKRKADQLDSRSNNKLVANVEGEAPATQLGPAWSAGEQWAEGALEDGAVARVGPRAVGAAQAGVNTGERNGSSVVRPSLCSIPTHRGTSAPEVRHGVVAAGCGSCGCAELVPETDVEAALAEDCNRGVHGR